MPDPEVIIGSTNFGNIIDNVCSARRGTYQDPGVAQSRIQLLLRPAKASTHFVKPFRQVRPALPSCASKSVSETQDYASLRLSYFVNHALTRVR